MQNSVSNDNPESQIIRTFFALRLRDQIIRQLANYADDLAVYDKKVEVDWVDSENYHLTLCFTGELPIAVVDELSMAAKTYLASQESVNIHLDSIESYQSDSGWTLLVAKTTNSPELDALHNLINTMVERAGVKINTEGFRPHVTLGRLDRGHDFQMPAQWPTLDLYSLADAVVLFQSKDGERGSVYTPLSIVELQDIS